LDGNGQLLPELPLPVGQGLPGARKRAEWAGFTPHERGIILGLVDALSSCAEHAPESGLPADWTTEKLAGAATALREDARATLRSMQLRQLVRRAFGRRV
jgi:hypothetical protein